MPPKKSQRRQQILEALAQMLEANPCGRITTAGLAKQVGVSEAALYRHFPSKSKMFEGLIEFIEETLFTRVSIILNEEQTAAKRCEKMLMLLLAFCERNPGITRILTGDALTGETQRLHLRVAQLYDRFETQLKQVLREAEVKEGLRPVIPLAAAANLLLSAAEGRISQYVRSGFERTPTTEWQQQWQLMIHGFFKEAVSQPIPGQARQNL
jgi:TetR/AcrR family transcriptional regulator